MSSNEPSDYYSKDEKESLLKIAHASILNGFKAKRASVIDISKYSDNLLLPRSTFITLYLNNELRGCIGSLTAQETLVQSVANNAFAAAFQDPRFPSMRQSEFRSASISLSILSLPEPILFISEADLISKIRPNIDGLILQDGSNKGTFLPSVWSSLPNPKIFLQHLKQKANLPVDYWSDTIKVERYTTEVIE